MSQNIELTITPIRKNHSSEEHFNELKRKNIWLWSDSKNNTSRVGDYFIFRFHNKKIIFHKIIDIRSPKYKLNSWDDTNRNVLVLSSPIKELIWDKWLKLDPPKNWMGTFRTVNLKYKWPLVHDIILSFTKQSRQTPSAKIISELIYDLNKYSDYSETLDNEDEITVTSFSLWFIIYCFNGFRGQGRNDLQKITNNSRSLLLGFNCPKDNVALYPKKILYDYRKISEKYYIWDNYCEQTFQLNILTGDVSHYCKGNKLKEDFVLLDSKKHKWEYYEKSQYVL